MMFTEVSNWPSAFMVVAALGQYFFGIALSLTAVFLILLVLVQRGRGGGLAGAFGGMGGQSAFGTKAGDTFTKVTIGVSVFWILLCIASVKLLGTSSGSFGTATAPEQSQFVPGGTGDPLGDGTLPEAGETTGFDPLGTTDLPTDPPIPDASPAPLGGGDVPTNPPAPDSSAPDTPVTEP